MSPRQLIEALMREFEFVSISSYPEPGEDVADYVAFYGSRRSAPPDKPKRIEIVRDEAIDALKAALNCESEKKCKGCDVVKKLHEYSKSKRSLDRRLNRCKMCERVRVRPLMAKLRKRLAAAGAFSA